MSQILNGLKTFYDGYLSIVLAITKFLVKLVSMAINLVINTVIFTYQTIKFFSELVWFAVTAKYEREVRIVFILGCLTGYIPVNEEFLVIFCFVCALRLIHLNVSDSITAALDERSEGIRKELSAFLLVKQENLNELYASEQNFLNTTKNLAILQNYCQTHFVHLDQNQQKALAGLVAQNLHAKLEALQVVKKSLQPTLHVQMSLSFREAVLENFKKMDTSESFVECLKEVKSA